MFDHVKFGVSDFEASKAFFLRALVPLGVSVLAEGSPDEGVELSLPGSEASLVPMPSTVRPWRPVARTTALRDCARSTTGGTTRPS
jgi:hypothetical protein